MVCKKCTATKKRCSCPECNDPMNNPIEKKTRTQLLKFLGLEKDIKSAVKSIYDKGTWRANLFLKPDAKMQKVLVHPDLEKKEHELDEETLNLIGNILSVDISKFKIVSIVSNVKNKFILKFRVTNPEKKEETFTLSEDL